ncbi:putative glycosidase CRH2 [Coemansia sp. Benny D160-2]|nr:putative glycosidase CRH2 [Coemansia sp. Benny D160-2]
MKTLSISLITLLLTFVGSAVGGQCGDHVCGKDTPCCYKGACNKNALYCGPFSCEAANSLTEKSCWATPHCVDHNIDFGHTPGSFAQVADYRGDPAVIQYVSRFEPSNAKLANNRVELTLAKQADQKGFGAVVVGTRAIQFGTVTAVLRSASTSGGVVSSFIIRNDDIGDEIDFEFVGSDRTTVQSNYYWHNELDYTKMVKSQPMADTTAKDITYQIVWTPDYIQWVADGNNFRTVRRQDTWDSASGVYKYPESESFVSFSVWDGGSGEKGTADWAGGAINWGAAPFVMAVKSVSVSCHFKGNETTYTPPAV